MIGKTNIPMGMSKGETVSILLNTNQSSNEDLNGVKVVVSYNDESHEYAYNGQFSVDIPKDKTYTVSFGEVNGYKTPSSVTYTAVKGFSRSIETTYYGEKVTVNVSAEEGASVDGQAVKVSKSPSIDDGEEYPIVNGKVSFSVPYDETYTVSLSDMDGYTTPESQSYTASQPTREISMEYKKAVEHLVVNVSSDDNAVSGYEINIFALEYADSDHQYYKLDYVESTGKQYIHNPEDGYTEYVYDIQFTSSDAGYTGTYSESGADMAVGVYDSNLELHFGSETNTYDCSPTDRITVKFDCVNQKAYVDDVVVISSANYSSAGLNNGLFALTVDGVVQSLNDCASMKMYSFKIYDDAVLIHNYIPAMRISDGIAGLYDTVDGEFFLSETDVNLKAGLKEFVIGTQTSATGEYDIPLGTGYIITASDVTGYITPESQTFTAESGTRTVDMVYKELKLGVFIQGASGKLYETASWTSQETPNGIAVLTENCRFVIALEDAYYTTCQWGSYATTVSGITTVTDASTAKTDYAGEAQTTYILNQLGDSDSTSDAPAAHYCRTYVFLNGKKGYLGAAGEWHAVFNNRDAIAYALSECGSLKMSNWYWTSTQYSAFNSWLARWDYATFEYCLKNKNRNVRAFCSL